MSREDSIQLRNVEKSLDGFLKYVLANEKIITINSCAELRVHFIYLMQVHNHFEKNFYLGNKKALLYNLRQYYE